MQAGKAYGGYVTEGFVEEAQVRLVKSSFDGGKGIDGGVTEGFVEAQFQCASSPRHFSVLLSALHSFAVTLPSLTTKWKSDAILSVLLSAIHRPKQRVEAEHVKEQVLVEKFMRWSQAGGAEKIGIWSSLRTRETSAVHVALRSLSSLRSTAPMCTNAT